jgi:hypothetical protein
MRRIALAAVLTTVAGLALAIPSGALAVTTIGSNLAGSPTVNLSCNPNCTVSPSVLPVANQAPGGFLAPQDGVVVRWRIKVGAVTRPSALRITRPGNSDTRTGAGTGPTVTPPINETSTYEARLPMQAGDALGLDCCADPTLMIDQYVFAPNQDAINLSWAPRLADGATPQSTTEFPPDAELLVNGDIEPDADHDTFGDETQDQCPTNAATQGPCPVTPAKKKKCKKKKKR